MCFTFWNSNILKHDVSLRYVSGKSCAQNWHSFKYFYFVFANDYNWVRLTLRVEAEWWFIYKYVSFSFWELNKWP